MLPIFVYEINSLVVCDCWINHLFIDLKKTFMKINVWVRNSRRYPITGVSCWKYATEASDKVLHHILKRKIILPTDYLFRKYTFLVHGFSMEQKKKQISPFINTWSKWSTRTTITFYHLQEAYSTFRDMKIKLKVN